MFDSRILEAARFAAIKHKGQSRKDHQKIPYLTRLIRSDQQPEKMNSRRSILMKLFAETGRPVETTTR